MNTHCKCGKALYRPKRNKSGLCRMCVVERNNSDPEYKARMIAAMTSPEARARAKAHWRAYCDNMPEAERERRRQAGYDRHRKYLSTPEMRERLLDPDLRKRAGEARSRTVMGWCPEDRIADHRYLVDMLKVPSAESRRMIEAEIHGTVEHARRVVQNAQDAQRIRHERDLLSQY